MRVNSVILDVWDALSVENELDRKFHCLLPYWDKFCKQFR